jgi:CBS domain-containing protein
MSETVRDLMTPLPTTVPPTATMQQAAMLMRDQQVGDVLVCDGDDLVGIVTDRDLVVRGLAETGDATVPVSELCTAHPITVEPDASIGKVAEMMAGNAIRRLPVVENGRLVGVVSLGDLAADREPASVLGEISTAMPDN